MIHVSEIKISDLLFLVPFILIIIIWTLLSALGIVNPILISNPYEVFQQLIAMLFQQTADGHSLLLTQIYYSYYRLFVSFGIASCVGVAFGILMGMSRLLNWFFDPILTLLMPIPGIAWAPVFMVWMGFGDIVIISVAAFAAFFPVVYNVSAGVRHIKKEYVWAAQSMGAKKRTLFWKIYLPFASPYIYTGLKLGLARGWKTVIAVEMIAASMWGLGFMIYTARDFFNYSVIYAGIVITAISFYLLEQVVIRWFEDRTIARWGMLRTGDLS